jgi:hypothetical protein
MTSVATADEQPVRVYPLSPPDGAVVGPHAVFQLGYEGSDHLRASRLRFRISMAPSRSGADAIVFDQRREPAGWAASGERQVLFRSRKPLPDGEYRWRVGFWDGVEWKEGTDRHAIRIDAVPPADVTGLRMRIDDERGEVLLEWTPVALDRDGRPEFVARYHVYRFQRRTFPKGVKSLEIGVVVEPRFVDREPPKDASRILYYRITAEDPVGNEPDVRN